MQPQHILLKAAPEAKVESFLRVVDLVRTHAFSNLIIATGSKKADLAESTR